MKMEVRMTLKVCYAFTKVNRRAADGAVHIISFVKEEFGQERAVLTCNASY